jgi:hypothetical protein
VEFESSKLDVWLAALQHRHRSAFTSAEFLKALRALSVRYVERRSELRHRSALDSAGKRAAFAAFYAPLHFVTTQAIVRALAIRGGALRDVIIDLGCGTGVASAAWALTQTDSPALLGIDSHPWALAEARWNWSHLGLAGEARRSDLVTEAERLVSRRQPALEGTGIVAGWSVNELETGKRRRLLAALIALAASGAVVLVIEPIARSAAPWWDEWAAAFAARGGRADEWKFETPLPPTLAALDEAAGFRRRGLAARSLSAGL